MDVIQHLISSSHIIIPYHHLISSSNIILPYHHVASSCRIIISFIISFIISYHLISSRIIISYRNPLSSSHIIISYHHLVSSSHIISYHHPVSSSGYSQVFKDGLRVVAESGTSSRYFSSAETKLLFQLGPADKCLCLGRIGAEKQVCGMTFLYVLYEIIAWL